VEAHAANRHRRDRRATTSAGQQAPTTQNQPDSGHRFRTQMPDASERNATVLQAARSRAGGITSDMCVVQSEQGSRPIRLRPESNDRHCLRRVKVGGQADVPTGWAARSSPVAGKGPRPGRRRGGGAVVGHTSGGRRLVRACGTGSPVVVRRLRLIRIAEAIPRRCSVAITTAQGLVWV